MTKGKLLRLLCELPPADVMAVTVGYLSNMLADEPDETIVEACDLLGQQLAEGVTKVRRFRARKVILPGELN